MALKGTLKDFGIADILQLIGQQQKTGALTLTRKDDQVAVLFNDGNIVKAETTHRNRKELIGSMLVAAQLVSEQQLDFALETQKRTLQRLGDVLVSQGVITEAKFKSMVQLQTSETLFRLFSWKTGNYEFEQKEIESEGLVTPLRAESVLMEGFRRVDEWPVVRKKITSLQMTFEKLKELPPEALAKDDFDSALDDAFGEPKEEKKSVNKGEFQSVGENERRAYNLIASGRTVERIIELSQLGEFETAKALCNLINLEYVKGLPPAGKGGADFDSEKAPSAFLAVLGRIAVSVVVVGALLFLATRIDFGAINLGGGHITHFTDPAVKRVASQQQRSRIATAIEVYRLEKGALPVALAELVESRLLDEDDLRFPWRDPYFYRRSEDGSYLLLPPLR